MEARSTPCSRTDQWRQEAHLLAGHTNSHICPVKSVSAYIAERGFIEGSLFTDRKGLPFTQQAPILSLQITLTKAGIDCTNYSGHSFLIWTTTTTLAKGVEEVYIRYIRLSHSELASQHLIPTHPGMIHTWS